MLIYIYGKYLFLSAYSSLLIFFQDARGPRGSEQSSGITTPSSRTTVLPDLLPQVF